MPRERTGFLFDLDGTLVDSVYDHVLAWQEALRAEGIHLSYWRIHRKIGMSGGLFTNMLLRETGLALEPERIERLAAQHADSYLHRISAIEPLPGARALLDHLLGIGLPVAVATSGRLRTAGPALRRRPHGSSEATHHLAAPAAPLSPTRPCPPA